MTTLDLGRLLTAMVTPFHEDGSLDLAGAEKLAAYLIGSGNDGIVVAGTTGESPTLSHQEKIDLLAAVRSAVPDHPLVMGTGTNDTAASIEMSREALRMGADAVMAVVPYYNKPPQKSLYAHFKAIADAIDGPLVMYNVPSRTIANLSAETAIRLSEVDNIVALKEATADMTQCAAIAGGVADGFRVYSGDDSLTLPMLALGFHGVVSVSGHFAAPGLRTMLTKFFDGDELGARELNARLSGMNRDLFLTTSPVPTKALFKFLGWDLGPTRLPLVMEEVTPAQLDALADTYNALGELAAELPLALAAGS